MKFTKINKTYEGILLYRSPSGNRNIFLNEIKEELSKGNPNINEQITQFLLGDINIDITKRKHCTKASKFFSTEEVHITHKQTYTNKNNEKRNNKNMPRSYFCWANYTRRIQILYLHIKYLRSLFNNPENRKPK